MSVNQKFDSLILQFDVEQFYYREAALLDDREYSQWLELFHPDVFYHAPIKRNVSRQNAAKEIGGLKDLAHFEENFDTLRRRVDRLNSTVAWTEQPSARTRRVVSNVRVEAGIRDDEVSVKSNFVLHGNRLDDEEFMFTGERQDVLKRVYDSFQIVGRRILMDQAIIRASSVSVLF